MLQCDICYMDYNNQKLEELWEHEPRNQASLQTERVGEVATSICFSATLYKDRIWIGKVEYACIHLEAI